MRMSRKKIEKKRANTSVLIRKADAFGAVIEAAAREESETDVLRRIDRIPPVEAENVAFLCDGRKCDSCSAECIHTLDVSHAKNFSKRDGAYFENEEPQKDQPGTTGGVFIPDVTVEMIRNAPLEGIEELLNNGEMYNVPKPTEGNRSLPAGDYISRADAIEAVANAIWHYPNECYYNLNDFDMAEALAKDALKALPSAEAVSREEYEELYHKAEEVNDMANDILSDFPSYKKALSADAVQGEWIEHKDCEGKTRTITCSRCGYKERSWVNMNFCPNCGTKMKGGGDE